MNASLVPETYEAWRHCIEVGCRIRLDARYIRQRITALADPEDFHTQQFEHRWGKAHRLRVLAWFYRAEDELQWPTPTRGTP